MTGESATNLVKGIKRDIAFTLPHYNEELITNILNEISTLYDEAHTVMQTQYSSQDPNVTALLLFYHLSLKRLRRAIMIYHHIRLNYIFYHLKSPRNECASSVSKKALLTQNMTAPEIDLLAKFRALRATFKKSFSNLDLFSGILRPPRELYIQVRALKECGIIQIESGVLALAKNSVHFVKYKDVENLLAEGFLEKISI